MPEPDLFVVCKNCGESVSPYVTECPYCGQRVRKRAPKLDLRAPRPPRRGGSRRRGRLPRARRDEIPGIALDTRPVATMAVVLVSLVATLVVRTDEVSLSDIGGLFFDPAGEWWRLAATPFIHDGLGYQLVALGGFAIFAVHLERRFGAPTPVLLFVLCGTAGAALAVALDSHPAFDSYPALGANGAALGTGIAWLIEDRLVARRGDDRGSDLIGAYVVLIVLALLPLADTGASFAATVGGAAAGAVGGLALGLFRR